MARHDRDQVKPRTPILAIEGLDVYYGRAHALQEVRLAFGSGVLGIVGRNGMGKTTLCNAITGLVPARGSIRLAGEEILGRSPHVITRLGVAYVPQGRRIWPSLTVDETLRLVARKRREVDRVYAMFPRLAERKANGGAQLSGGEQQMLAIGRALLLEPRLLVMDEPTEGLAPIIVEHVVQALRELQSEREISVLLVEQNLGVAIDVAQRVAVMVNGRIASEHASTELGADAGLRQRLLGLRSQADEAPVTDEAAATSTEPMPVWTVQRAFGASLPNPRAATTVRGYTRWNAVDPMQPVADVLFEPAPPAASPTPSASATAAAAASSDMPRPAAQVIEFPVSASAKRAAYVAGTFDTKGRELNYIRQCLEKLGVRTVTVDLSTSGAMSSASVHPREVARHHPGGEAAVFTHDRGSAVTAMALAFERYVATRADLGGLISAGGSGATALATSAMRSLPIGLPKVMVSTMASGDVRPYVGPSDICMMYSVTDVQGINRISERVLANGAHALAGMLMHAPRVHDSTKPALGLTMFGVTTPCVQTVTKALSEHFDCIVFHATGTGGQSMEKLVASGLLRGVIDVSTTEIADEIGGGVLSAGPTRLDVFAQHALPYVGSCGALDMVNFGAWNTVPERLRGRNLYRHNSNVTLMRTTPDECRAIGQFLVAKLNAMIGPVRFLIPEGGVSSIDQPGQPFHDPAANRVLFDTLAQGFRSGAQRKLVRLPHHINDDAFAAALVNAWHEVSAVATARRA